MTAAAAFGRPFFLCRPAQAATFRRRALCQTSHGRLIDEVTTETNDKAYVGVAITKVEKNEDGSLFVFGKATGPDLDLDDQIIDQDFAVKAVGDWFSSFGNIRQMHSTALAPAGKAVELESRDDGEYIKAKVVEPGAIKLTEEGVYSAFSIGISRPRIVRDATATNGRIVDGVVTEVSLVDYPANPTCKFALTKAASLMVEDGDVKADEWADVGEHELVDDVHKAQLVELTKAAEEPKVESLEEALAGDEPEAEVVEPETVEEPAAEPAVEEPEPAEEVEVEPEAEVEEPAAEAEVVQLPAAPAQVEAAKVPELVKRITEATVEKAGAGSAALAAVHALLCEELAEDGGTGSECWEIEWLADLYSSLVYWVAEDEWEDAWEEAFAELAAKPDTAKTKTLLTEIVERRQVEKLDLAGEAQPTVEAIEAAVAKAMSSRDTEIAELRKMVDELGSQPDPSKAPFRGGTGGTVPVNLTDDVESPEEITKAADSGAELQKKADYRRYVVEMTKHPVPSVREGARAELHKLDAEAVAV